MSVYWLTGDVLDHVRALPDNSIDLVATSPPFLALESAETRAVTGHSARHTTRPTHQGTHPMIALIALAAILTAALAAVYAYKAARWYRLRVHEHAAAWAARKYHPQIRSLTSQLRGQAAEAERLRQLLAKAEPQMQWAIEARSAFPSFARVFDRLQHADAEQLETLVDELTTTLDTIDVASLAGYTVTMANPRPPVLEGTGA